MNSRGEERELTQYNNRTVYTCAVLRRTYGAFCCMGGGDGTESEVDYMESRV